MKTLLLALSAVAALALPARAGAPPASRLAADLERIVLSQPEMPVVFWVHFADRAGRERDASALAELRRLWPARSLDRRFRRGQLTGVDASDLPVHAPYVRALAARGARVRGVSRWLNAASVEGPARLAGELSRLPFVARVERVETGRPATRPLPPDHGEATTSDPQAQRAGAPAIAGLAPGDTAYYGPTFRQLQMMRVPEVHASGLSGAGVLVAMLDTGFRLDHAVFAGLDVVATRDFINQDAHVGFDPAQDHTTQPNHGTQTLACVAGSLPGVYSGAAFGASVALAKTEYVPTETQAEMDYWQFAAEWADSLGADVISSSLGYTTFDAPPSYGFADMDGRTTVVTRAAAAAARRGITVVTAAGNAGGSSWRCVVAPGDADTVITVGAVDSLDVVASFSSGGPTSDGRIKPDVVAMGRSVRVPRADTTFGYFTTSGTSFSTPLTAGVVALLLEAHPTWGPFEIREALRETALNHATPDTVRGWGLVQAPVARSWVPSTVSVPAPVATAGLALAVHPNPARPGVGATLTLAAPGAGRVAVDVLDLSGRRLARVFEGEAAGARVVRWDGRDDRGAVARAGVYWVRVAGAQGATRSARLVLLN